MVQIKTWRERWKENPVSTSRKSAMMAEIAELRAALACAAQAAMPVPQPSLNKTDLHAALDASKMALTAMLEQFTRTPSTLKDSAARNLGHAALKLINDAALAAPILVAEPSEQYKLDAQRYRFLRHADLDDLHAKYYAGKEVPEGEEFDRIIDIAIAMSAAKEPGK